jgi:hypothetical protein
MPNIVTVLTEFSDKENSRTYTSAGHTVVKPRIVVQKRKVAPSVDGVATDTLSVVFGSVDSVGLPLNAKIAFEVNIRRSPQALTADISAAKALFREIVASDEFNAVVDSQNYVKA